MRLLTDKELQEFSSIVKLSQPGLKRVMQKLLTKAKYKHIINTEDYIVAEGNIPIALVAHLDTVFIHAPDEIFYDTTHNVLWSPEGLGADDRAGVYGIIKIIGSGLRPHIILTTDEEKGGVGAYELAKYQCPFKELKYIIELDRRGDNDCVFYDCDNKEFVNYVEQFGFAEAIGSFSDISAICPAWMVAGVNLSIGYKDEHSETERLYVNSFFQTIERVKKMLKAHKTVKEPFVYVERVYKNNYYYNKLMKNYQKYPGFVYAEEEFDVCDHCGRSFIATDLIEVIASDGTTDYLCADCIAKNDNIGYCLYCQTPFEMKHENEYLCPHCMRELIDRGVSPDVF